MRYSNNSCCLKILNKYSGILKSMADQMSIDCGLTEDWNDWIVRILYSSVAPIALASLYDLNDDNQPVSVIHFRRRVQLQLECYQDMYKPCLDDVDLNYLKEYIYKALLNTGHMYHLDDHLKPVVRTEVNCTGITFIRGQAPGEIVRRSGLGAYLVNRSTDNDFDSVRRMFHLPDTDLTIFWKQLVRDAKFRPLDDKNLDAYEFLQWDRSHGGRYWKDHPDDGVISVARTKALGNKTYYLYRHVDDVITVHQIETWKVEDYQYRRITCACLKNYDMLPPLHYHDDTIIVRVRLEYLLPPEELWLFKLYSWPFNIKEACSNQLKDDKKLSDFGDRYMARDVFYALKPIYEQLGFAFKKEYMK